MDWSKQMTDEELRKLAEKARQTAVRLALWEPYQLYNVLADGIEELLDRVEKAEQEAFDFVKQKAKEGAREKRELESRVRKAEQALQRVRELHVRTAFDDEPTEFHCKPCQITSGIWPCPTIRALEGDE